MDFITYFHSTAFQSALGTIGNIMGIVLYLAPLPMFQDIVRKGSADKYTVAPFLCGLMSSCIWSIYGSQLVANSVSILVGSALGVFANGTYCLIYLCYTQSSKAMILYSFGAVMLACASAATVASCLAVSLRCFVFGIIGDVASSISISAPLAAVVEMVRTRNADFFPIHLCAVSLVNSVIWTAFGLSLGDFFILMPNILGLLMAAMQVTLYSIYSGLKPVRRISKVIVFDSTEADAEKQASDSMTDPLLAVNLPSTCPTLETKSDPESPGAVHRQSWQAVPSPLGASVTSVVRSSITCEGVRRRSLFPAFDNSVILRTSHMSGEEEDQKAVKDEKGCGFP